MYILKKTQPQEHKRKCIAIKCNCVKTVIVAENGISDMRSNLTKESLFFTCR